MKRNLAVVVLGLVGALQLLGLVTGSSTLRGLGQMSAASPLPLVFSHFRGRETFAADFEVRLERTDGTMRTVALTPELYAKLDGPYNRRNVYGAVFAYGPALDRPNERALVRDVVHYGFCDPGPVARRFGEAQVPAVVTLVARSKTAGASKARAKIRVVCEVHHAV